VRPCFRLPSVTSIALALALALLPGCRGQTPPQANGGGGGGPRASPEPTGAHEEVGASLSRLLNDAQGRFRALNYEYDEDLLVTIDRVEAYLSGKSPGPAPRAMPKLDEQEEMDHFTETIRRWKAKTGKDLRVEIDALKAEVAARKPGGPAFHPDFHKHFSLVFDDFIPIEVAEIRERRNRYLHEKAKPLFDAHRAKFPDVVREHESFLDKPPYNLPPPDTTHAVR
jgi:hypothetical protein